VTIQCITKSGILSLFIGTDQKNTVIFLWSNSFTGSLSVPHSTHQMAAIMMTTMVMKEMLLQTMNIEFWFPRE
jgi:hypothetical protein